MYKWSWIAGSTSNSIYGEKAQTITGIFSAINGAWVTTNTWYRYTWQNSPVTASGSFTVDLKEKTWANWKVLSNARDGACGSGTLTATVSQWLKWTCKVDGDNLTYTPQTDAKWSDTCTLKISDDEGSTAVEVEVTWKNINSYIELLDPENNAEVDQWSVTFTWAPRDLPSYKKVSGYKYQIWTKSWMVSTTWITLNLPAGTYPWSVVVVYTGGTVWWSSDYRSVKTVKSKTKDDCPSGDLSPSFYDGTCSSHSAPDCYIANYSDEIDDAYEYAYTKWVTTKNNICQADMDGYLYRDHFAKMISVYAINVAWRTPKYGKAGCDQFSDIGNDSAELQNYMNECRLSHAKDILRSTFNRDESRVWYSVL